MRALHPAQFMPRGTTRAPTFAFCPETATKMVEHDIIVDGVRQTYINRELKKISYLSVAVAVPSNRLLGFVAAIRIGATEVELAFFCCSGHAAFGLELDPRYAVKFYEYWEEEMKKKGFFLVKIKSVMSAERFWYERGFRYDRTCETSGKPKVDQKICSGESDDENLIPMFKCI